MNIIKCITTHLSYSLVPTKQDYFPSEKIFRIFSQLFSSLKLQKCNLTHFASKTMLETNNFAGMLGQVRLGQVRLGQVRLGQVRLGQIRLGQVRLGQVRLGQVWFGLFGQVSLGQVRLGQTKYLFQWLRQTAHDQEVVGLNPGTIYWEDVSNYARLLH